MGFKRQDYYVNCNHSKTHLYYDSVFDLHTYKVRPVFLYVHRSRRWLFLNTHRSVLETHRVLLNMCCKYYLAAKMALIYMHDVKLNQIFLTCTLCVPIHNPPSSAMYFEIINICYCSQTIHLPDCFYDCSILPL